MTGMPEVIGHLNGAVVPDFFSLPTFLAKFFSCAFGVASGLPVGPEGPMSESLGSRLQPCLSLSLSLSCLHGILISHSWLVLALIPCAVPRAASCTTVTSLSLFLSLPCFGPGVRFGL